jgi:hypothetical protein
VTDQLEDLFADLRADTLTRVRPPGAAAAHQTVRRRRTTRTTGAAAFVAVVAAGGIGSHVLGPLPFFGVAAPDPATLAERQGRAATAVGLNPDDQRQTRLSGQGIAAAGVIATGLLVAGTYTLRIACVGPGRLTAVFRIENAPGVTLDVVKSADQRCDATGKVATRTFRLATNLTIISELRPDRGAADRSGYALTLTLAEADRQRLTDSARMRLPRLDARKAAYGVFGLMSRAGTDASTTLGAGEYRLHYVCTGVGRVEFTVQVRSGAHVVSEWTGSAVCGLPAAVTPTRLVVHRGNTFRTVVTPDADAAGQAGYADVLERV